MGWLQQVVCTSVEVLPMSAYICQPISYGSWAMVSVSLCVSVCLCEHTHLATNFFKWLLGSGQWRSGQGQHFNWDSHLGYLIIDCYWQGFSRGVLISDCYWQREKKASEPTHISESCDPTGTNELCCSVLESQKESQKCLLYMITLMNERVNIRKISNSWYQTFVAGPWKVV